MKNVFQEHGKGQGCPVTDLRGKKSAERGEIEAMVILREQLLGIGESTAISRIEFAVDDVSELDDYLSLIGRTAATASLAWDLSTGNIYALNSHGEWKLQTN